MYLNGYAFTIILHHNLMRSDGNTQLFTCLVALEVISRINQNLIENLIQTLRNLDFLLLEWTLLIPYPILTLIYLYATNIGVWAE